MLEREEQGIDEDDYDYPDEDPDDLEDFENGKN